MSLAGLVDVYVIRARILPVVLVSVPIALVAFVWTPDVLTNGRGVGIGGVLWLLATLVLAQVGRDAGRRRQSALFDIWGGSPTTKRLRHRGAQNATLLHRRHAQLAVLTGVRLPAPQDEANDPRKADEIYETCVGVLREKTRDRKTFTIVFDENCSYGFRRNLWGLKPVGSFIAAVVLVASAGYVTTTVARTGDVTVSGAIVALGSAVVSIGWLFVTPEWVRLAGEAYAEALLAACERVSGAPALSSTRKTAKIQEGS
jgi:hypothetical protein